MGSVGLGLHATDGSKSSGKWTHTGCVAVRLEVPAFVALVAFVAVFLVFFTGGSCRPK